MTQHRAQDAGFTLLELLAVLGILALMAALVVPAMRRSSPTQDVTAAAIELAAGLKVARAAARTRNVEQALVLSLDRRMFWSENLLPPKAFPGTLSLDLDVPESERPDSATGRIRFFPDGTATPARLTLRAGKAEATLAVEWLTGEIRSGGRP